MKEMKQENEGQTCNACSNCGMGCSCGRMHGYSGHPILRILLALAIVGFAFCIGMRVGELKQFLSSGYDHQYQQGYPMMRHGNMMYGQEEGQAMPITIVAPAARTASPAAAPAVR